MSWVDLDLEILEEFASVSSTWARDEAFVRRTESWRLRRIERRRSYERERARRPHVRKKQIAANHERARRYDAELRAQRAARPAWQILPIASKVVGRCRCGAELVVRDGCRSPVHHRCPFDSLGAIPALTSATKGQTT